MSNDGQRSDQIAFHFYTKLFYVVNQARTTSEPRTQPKVDKWFNLETPDSDLFTKETREPYKSISLTPPPPLEIQVLLTVPDLSPNQVLVHSDPDSSRTRIHPTPRYVLLESYVLDFAPLSAPGDVALPTIYKAGIPLFRSLFTLLRTLPAWKLHKRLRRRISGGPTLGITLKVRTSEHDPDILTFESTSLRLQTQTHIFAGVPHPMGTFELSVQYLTSPTFQLDELESLLSSRFFSLDEGPFIPTLVKNHHRDSSVSRSNSMTSTSRRDLAPSTSPPNLTNFPTTRPRPTSRSPPNSKPTSSSPLSTALADRFILPNPNLASSSTSSSSITRNSQPHVQPRGIPLPLPIRQTASGSGSGGSIPRQSLLSGSAPRQSLSSNTNTHSSPGSIPRQSLLSGSAPRQPLSRPPTASGRVPSGLEYRAGTPSGAEQRQIPSGIEATRTRLRKESLHLRSSSASSSKSSLSPTNSFFTPNPNPHSHVTSSPEAHNHTTPQSNLTLNTTNLTMTPFPISSATPQTTQTTPRKPVYPFPFKSNTLSSNTLGSSSSLSGAGAGTGGASGPSSLSDRMSLHDRIVSAQPSSLSDRMSLQDRIVSGPPSNMSHGGTPSSQEATAGDEQTSTAPQRKRYSSSFGHRYAGTGLGLPGSAGSTTSTGGTGGVATGGAGVGESSLSRHGSASRRERVRSAAHPPYSPSRVSPQLPQQNQLPPSPPFHQRSASTSAAPSAAGSFMGHAHTDDDDISIFVQDIDMRKPLVGRGRERRERERENDEREQDTSDAQKEEAAPRQGRENLNRDGGGTSGTRPMPIVGSPPAGMMLTSEWEVDERLKKMNEVFFASLEGLGGGRGGTSSTASGSNGSARERERRRESLAERERRHIRSVSGNPSGLQVARDLEVERERDRDRESGAGRGRSTSVTSPNPLTSPRGDALGRNDGPFAARNRTERSSSRAERGTSFPSIFRPRVSASRDRSEEVIGRLELDYEGSSGSGSGSGGGSRQGRREPLGGRY